MSRSKKYSRILQAAKYYSAIDNYIKYITDASKRGSRVGQGTARPESTLLFLRPFGIDLPAETFAQTRSPLPSVTLIQTQLGNRARRTLAAGGTALRLANFTPAKVVITRGRSTSGTVATSKVTGLKYLDYGGNSTSVAFGALNDNEEPSEAFTTLRTAVQAAVAGSAVTIKPEIVR